MIDFHTHIMPNIDDGSNSMEETLNMIKEAKKAGFDEIILTSHYFEGYYEAKKEERKSLLYTIKDNLVKQNINVKLYLGNEIYVSNNIFKLLEDECACSINDSCYVLFEMPLKGKPLNIYNLIYDLMQYKLIPILAHPERYSFVQNEPKIIYELIKKGVLMQANYGSVIGQYGERAKIIVKKLLKYHMIHFLGTDVHAQNSIYPKIPKILNKIEEIIGKDNLEMISDVNPKLALLNKKIDIVEPREIELSLKDKILMRK